MRRLRERQSQSVRMSVSAGHRKRVRGAAGSRLGPIRLIRLAMTAPRAMPAGPPVPQTTRLRGARTFHTAALCADTQRADCRHAPRAGLPDLASKVRNRPASADRRPIGRCLKWTFGTVWRRLPGAHSRRRGGLASAPSEDVPRCSVRGSSGWEWTFRRADKRSVIRLFVGATSCPFVAQPHTLRRRRIATADDASLIRPLAEPSIAGREPTVTDSRI
jgi:hypothetical protein